MTIVCGTDFSENAEQAARAAGAIARRLGVALKLVHVVELSAGHLTIGGPHDPAYDLLHEQIGKLADDLRGRLGIAVEPIITAGLTDEKLVEVAQAAGARLLVVSSLGGTKQHRWLLGSVAERVAQASPIPVLVVRDAASIEAWVLGNRALRIVVGVDLEPASRAALRWVAELRAIARCDVQVTQIVAPILEHHRLGIPAPIPLDGLRPELREILLRELRAWAGELPGEGETTFEVGSGWGRVDSHLTALAAQAGADLVVVGTHQRAGIARLWQGSVSRGVLQYAAGNVASVPRGQLASDEQAIPTFRRVLVPTDFSALANRAIPVGYGLVAPGGVVHLLHVVTTTPLPEDPDPRDQLKALIPPGAAARGVASALEAVRDDDPFMGIWHLANRLGVDAICMATRGGSGIVRAVLGSQARQLVQRARQPVVLVPPAWPIDSDTAE